MTKYTPTFEIKRGEDGFDVIERGGFTLSGVPTLPLVMKFVEGALSLPVNWQQGQTYLVDGIIIGELIESLQKDVQP
jgi:hypothetical protein